MTTALNLINQKFQGQNKQTISARDLHALLGSKRKFADWIKARVINSNIFKENEDYIHISQNYETRTGGTKREEYYLTLKCASLIATAENKKGLEIGYTLLSNFEKMQEEVLKLQSQYSNLMNILCETNKEFFSLKEKTLYLESAQVISKNKYNLQEAAKELGACEKKFCQRLRELGLLEHKLEYGKPVNVPTWKAQGLIFKEKKNINGFDRTQSFITKEGIKYFKSRITEYFSDILKEEVKRLVQTNLTNLQLNYEEKKQLLISL
jgi:anti-repressor protein